MSKQILTILALAGMAGLMAFSACQGPPLSNPANAAVPTMDTLPDICLSDCWDRIIPRDTFSEDTSDWRVFFDQTKAESQASLDLPTLKALIDKANDPIGFRVFFGLENFTDLGTMRFIFAATDTGSAYGDDVIGSGTLLVLDPASSAAPEWLESPDEALSLIQNWRTFFGTSTSDTLVCSGEMNCKSARFSEGDTLFVPRAQAFSRTSVFAYLFEQNYQANTETDSVIFSLGLSKSPRNLIRKMGSPNYYEIELFLSIPDLPPGDPVLEFTRPCPLACGGENLLNNPEGQ